MKIASFILLITALIASGCADHKDTPEAGQVNVLASLPAGFNFNKMGFKMITSTVNKKLGTMATLYGNGSAIALVTWKQQADKRWIGGNIPGDLLSVEMLKAGTDIMPTVGTYTRFKGAGLKADPDTSGQNARAKYILSLRPSIMF